MYTEKQASKPEKLEYGPGEQWKLRSIMTNLATSHT